MPQTLATHQHHQHIARPPAPIRVRATPHAYEPDAGEFSELLSQRIGLEYDLAGMLLATHPTGARAVLRLGIRPGDLHQQDVSVIYAAGGIVPQQNPDAPLIDVLCLARLGLQHIGCWSSRDEGHAYGAPFGPRWSDSSLAMLAATRPPRDGLIELLSEQIRSIAHRIDTATAHVMAAIRAIRGDDDQPPPAGGAAVIAMAAPTLRKKAGAK